MAITIKTQPNKYSAAYSYLPLRIFSDRTNSYRDFKYLINIEYDSSDISSGIPVSIEGELYTNLNVVSPHSFNVGDKVILNNSVYKGIFDIVNIPNSMNIIISLELTLPIPSDGTVSRVIPYKMSPNLKGEAELDLSNTIKDFVTEDFTDTGIITNSPNSEFSYKISIGEEGIYYFNFFDNHFTSGQGVGFVNSSLTSSDIPTLPLSIGDSINIQQELAKWEFDDNNFEGGLVKLISTNKHDFRVGQSVTVQGAILNDYYNGMTKVVQVVDDYSFVIDKPWGVSTPAEPGAVFGTPRPEYNTVATITDIYFAPGYGVVIVTDVPYGGGTEAIGGTITFSDERTSSTYFISETDDKHVYNARTKTSEYTQDEFNKYVVQVRNPMLNNISTILGNKHSYRVEKSTKSWLLVHNDSTLQSSGGLYTWKDSNGTVLGKTFVGYNKNSFRNYYVPVGIDQILSLNALDYTTNVDVQSIAGDIDSYTIQAASSITSFKTNAIKFDLNDDCSRYDIFHLCWKDRRGSWLSYPFKYINTQSTEFDRKTFYKKEGSFNDDNTFDFKQHGRGEKSYYNRSRDKMMLNSGFIDEFENELIKDLLNSSSVYVQTPDNAMLGCIVEDKSKSFGQAKQDSIWQYNIEVRLSTNDYRF